MSPADDLKRIWISEQVSGASVALPALERLFTLNSEDHTPQIVCAQLAKDLGVRDTEVGSLWIQGESLRFLFPTELSRAGVIPLSSSAIAARTAKTRRSERINNFAQIQHFSVFEMIELGNARSDGQCDAQTIQKMMSVPIYSHKGKVCGVLQVSRKGFDLDSAGPDFTTADLQRLELAAAVVGRLLDHTGSVS